jgi:hypothetical protein
LLVDGGLYLLFDLNEDPSERRDLAAQHSDLVLELKMRLTDWEKEVDQKAPSESVTLSNVDASAAIVTSGL